MGQSSNSFLEVGVVERLVPEHLTTYFPQMCNVLCNDYTKDTRLTCEIHRLLLCTVTPPCIYYVVWWPPNLSLEIKNE